MALTAKEKKMQEEWEIREAMGTLQRAEEIKRNPQLMKKVRIEAAKKQKELAVIAKGSNGTPSATKKKTNKR